MDKAVSQDVRILTVSVPEDLTTKNPMIRGPNFPIKPAPTSIGDENDGLTTTLTTTTLSTTTMTHTIQVDLTTTHTPVLITDDRSTAMTSELREDTSTTWDDAQSMESTQATSSDISPTATVDSSRDENHQTTPSQETDTTDAALATSPAPDVWEESNIDAASTSVIESTLCYGRGPCGDREPIETSEQEIESEAEISTRCPGKGPCIQENEGIGSAAKIRWAVVGAGGVVAVAFGH